MSGSLKNPPKHFRAKVSHGATNVDREGGMFGAGMISGISLISRGEALGHDLWVDADFVSDVTHAVNESKAEHGGVKARFTHPGLSSDGLASRLGRVVNARTVGDRSIADLHFLEAAHKTPDGDLAEHIFSLAEEDPDSFGISIVFEHDLEAQNEQTEAHSVEGVFVSPDEDNRNNYLHARLARLRAADVVDDPAANPDGLFHSHQEAASDAEEIVSYALGITDQKPSASMFDVDPDRISGFVARFLDRHNLKVEKMDPEQTEQPEGVEGETSTPTREEFSAELKKYTDAFGADRGVEWFGMDLDFDTAEVVFEALSEEFKALQEKVEELEATLASLDRGEDDSAEFQAGDVAPKKSFADYTRRNSQN